MRWIVILVIAWFIWSNYGKNNEVLENYSESTINAAAESYDADPEDLTEDQLDEAQQEMVDAATDNCTIDCSGHKAGYEWAESNAISDEGNCNGDSDSFNEGCVNYVNGGSGY